MAHFRVSSAYLSENKSSKYIENAVRKCLSTIDFVHMLQVCPDNFHCCNS